MSLKLEQRLCTKYSRIKPLLKLSDKKAGEAILIYSHKQAYLSRSDTFPLKWDIFKRKTKESKA